MTDPNWEPVMKLASAIVTNRGGRTCHAAIIARELGIPAVVGCANATDILVTDREVTVSCAEGDEGRIYDGLIETEIEEVHWGEMPDIRSEEHTSELQSLMRISYAVFCLKKKKN